MLVQTLGVRVDCGSGVDGCRLETPVGLVYVC